MNFSRMLRRIRRSIPPFPELPSARHILRWFRDLPPIPKAPAPRRIIAWFRARSRRRKILFRWALVIAALAALRFGAPPVSHLIKGWQARRIAREASVLIEKEEWFE